MSLELLDKTGLAPCVPCDVEFRSSGVDAPIVAILNFKCADDYMNWDSDDVEIFCGLAIDRGICTILMVAPDLEIEGYYRHWGQNGKPFYMPF